MLKIQKKLNDIQNNIVSISYEYGINPKNIKILVVSKSRSIEEIKKVILCKQYNFGESYVQESLLKINTFKHIQWHFIGNIQSNKIRFISTNFSWCHTVKNENTAKMLNKYRFNMTPKLNILIQIDIRNNFITSKLNINNFKTLVKKITFLENLNLRGIMGMPYKCINYNDQLKSYKHIKLYSSIIKDIHPEADTISLGTSHDMKAAIISGSTLIRIGSLIFN
ncbi:YggS family pyridoxal phosphate-dependent enzyme [Buchnera aphidicola]|uniref:Pyridoxal phosphate homeostasis protein n=1 Tax=Buchnera aphidicola subsp. Melaphis rhois TaxID=118103 RepID=A0A4D6YBS4_BUCMH|nr:YggS family pyridoxal phosphate-dependent enzyme [Buchnera aphidicola]QCI23508.1 YggS family pyridoxal phosphate-dependent enzyme [Buchnera aphidicola (Melaphis rhois)]